MNRKIIYPDDELLEKIEKFRETFEKENGVPISFSKACCLLIKRGIVS